MHQRLERRKWHEELCDKRAWQARKQNCVNIRSWYCCHHKLMLWQIY